MTFRPRWKAVSLPLLLSLLWCLFMVALYQRGNAEKDAHTNELALTQARTLYTQVLDTRSWNAAHGGVYVPESAYGVPNPWIPEAQRTLQLANGQRLVLMNPAYMSRQIGDLTSIKGTSFRITSHAPLRPENASDLWETQALTRCMQGAPEVFALFRDEENPRYRYLSALHAKGDCLSCHTTNVVGEVRGGISVSLDARPFLQASEEQEKNLRWAFGLMGLTGVLGIGGTSFLARRKRMLAEERERMKSAFLANMSHDMRTPLTGILGMSDLLERPQNEEQRRAAVRYLHMAGAALLEMVSDITDYAALDAGQVQLSQRPFAVRQVLQRCVELFEPQCRAKGLHLRLQVEDDVPARVLGDEFRLRQALGNLISNAMKFTARGGVDIKVTRDSLGEYAPTAEPGPEPAVEQGVLAASATASFCVLRFAVEDTGVGIAAQDQRRIFERFERGSAASEGYGGTGLGLSIAQDLAVLMGGTLDVRSTLGQGSCFTLSVRFAVDAEAPGQEAQTGAADPAGPSGQSGQSGQSGAATDDAMPSGSLPSAPRPLSVLVGEDNAITSHYLEQILTRQGYTVRVAGDGRSVLRMVEETMPDVVLLDMRMPELDGLDTTRALRQGAGASLPVVVLSASVSVEERQAFAALGVQAHLLKPVGARELMRVLSEAVEAVLPCAAQTPPSPSATPAPLPMSAQAPRSPGDASLPLFDKKAALEDLDGDAALLRKLAELWLAEVEQRRVEILQAQELEDAATVQRVAHGWKNSSAVLHLCRLHAACAQLEKAHRHEHAHLLPAVLAAVEEAVHVLQADIPSCGDGAQTK